MGLVIDFVFVKPCPCLGIVVAAHKVFFDILWQCVVAVQTHSDVRVDPDEFVKLNSVSTNIATM